MDIFGIGWLELMFILIIAMIVVGPRDLSKVGKQMGRFLNRIYKSDSWKMLNDASRTLRNLPNRLAREAALEDLDSLHKSIKDTGNTIKSEIQDVNSSLASWTPPRVPPKPNSDDPPEQPTKPAEGEEA